MNVVFLGMNSDYSVMPLLAIREEFKVCGVFELRAAPAFRDKLKSSVKRLIRYRSSGAFSLEKSSVAYGIPFLAADRVDDLSFLSWIKDKKPDLICVAGFGKKIPKEILDIPALGVINIHAGPLPVYRGAHPFFYLIKNREVNGGVSIHWMNEKFDDGLIIQVHSFPLIKGMNLAMYNTICGYKAAQNISAVLRALKNGTQLPVVPNDPARAVNCYSPQKNTQYIGVEYTVDQALWLFNAYSDVVRFKAALAEGNIPIVAMSCLPFEGSRSLQLKDGMVYIT